MSTSMSKIQSGGILSTPTSNAKHSKSMMQTTPVSVADFGSPLAYTNENSNNYASSIPYDESPNVISQKERVTRFGIECTRLGKILDRIW